MPVPGGRVELPMKGQEALQIICLVQAQAGNVIFRSVRLLRFLAPFSLQDTSWEVPRYYLEVFMAYL